MQSSERALQNRLQLPWPFLAGIIAILILPLFSQFPYFAPPAWGQALFFRSIVAVLLFFALAWLLQKGAERVISRTDPARAPILALLAYAGVLFLALFTSLDPHFSFWGTPYRAWGLLTYAFYILFALGLYLFLRPQQWNSIWNTLFATGTAAVLIGIGQQFGLFADSLVSSESRPYATFGNTIFFAIFLSVLLPFAIVWFLKAKGWWKIAYGALSLLFLYAILITETRGVFLGVAAGALFFLLVFPAPMRLLKKMALPLFALAFLLLILVNTVQPPAFVEQTLLFSRLWDRLSLEQIWETEPRFGAWPYAISAIQEKPLLGYGPYNSSIPFNTHFDSASSRFEGRTTGWWDTFHNYYLDIAIGAGLLGLFAFFAFIGLLWRGLQRAKKSAQHKTALLDIHAAQTALLVYLVAMIFSFNSFGTYLVFFVLVGYSFFLIAYAPQNSR